MKLCILIIILLFNNYKLSGQNENKKINRLEIHFKVWKETEKDYRRFIKKQGQIRKKLDEHIEYQDLKKIKKLKSVYYKLIKEKEKGDFIRHERNTFNDYMKAHEIINPMLDENKELYKIAEYLSEKYNKQIEPIKRDLFKNYEKLRKKEENIYLKHVKKQEQVSTSKYWNYPKDVRQSTYKERVYNNIKIILLESEK